MASEPKKKMFLLIASITCLVAAAIVLTLYLWPKDTCEGLEGQSFWIMCRNPNCNATWQMNAKAFLEYQKKYSNPQDPIHPALAACPKCNEKTGDIAIKCPKCDTVFFEGSVPDASYQDRCPNCNFSKSEEQINEKNK
jgi:hypothetical protein